MKYLSVTVGNYFLDNQHEVPHRHLANVANYNFNK